MNTSSGNFFDRYANKFDTFYDEKRGLVMQWLDQRFRRDMFVRFAMTFEFLGDLSGKSIVDIGCGSGPYIVEALKLGASHVTGIDPAPGMLSLAKERIDQYGMQERVTLIEGYFPQTCPQGPFDFAIVMGVMDYIGDAESFLRVLRNIVSQGAVLSFPSTHWFRTPFRKVRYKLRNCPVFFYTDAKIDLLMQKVGLEEYKLVKIPGAGMDYVLWIST